jgi:hypothetical protein
MEGNSVATLWARIVTDVAGRETIVTPPSARLPLVSTSEQDMLDAEPQAFEYSRAHGRPVRLARFVEAGP